MGEYSSIHRHFDTRRGKTALVTDTPYADSKNLHCHNLKTNYAIPKFQFQFQAIFILMQQICHT